MDKEQDRKFAQRLGAARHALFDALMAWPHEDEHLIENYPKGMASFDDFVYEFAAWVENVGDITGVDVVRPGGSAAGTVSEDERFFGSVAFHARRAGAKGAEAWQSGGGIYVVRVPLGGGLQALFGNADEEWGGLVEVAESGDVVLEEVPLHYPADGEDSGELGRRIASAVAALAHLRR